MFSCDCRKTNIKYDNWSFRKSPWKCLLYLKLDGLYSIVDNFFIRNYLLLMYHAQTMWQKIVRMRERACVPLAFLLISIKRQIHVIKTSNTRFWSGQHLACEFTILATGSTETVRSWPSSKNIEINYYAQIITFIWSRL